ncbi:zinc finger protein 316-like isoform X2 [Perca flavescens]|uniref:zinc finger protein 316-like isoform X2 n=1 Tax=Perca flavescens TaxID=8167 RepID=UPI00106EDCE2|nr:zinc finger protein 316-like isoform X2 [Perca flavescens]
MLSDCLVERCFDRVCVDKNSLCDCVKMSKVQILRALVKQRLTAAAEEIFGLFERTIAEYEEERCRSKEENERQRKRLDADVQQLSVREEEVPPEQREWSSSLDQQHPEPPHIKEEQEELWISQEREQLQGLEEADITKFSFTPVLVKSEDDEEKPQPSQLHQRQTELMETEADGEDCGGPEPAKNSDPDRHPEPKTDDKTGDSSEPETDDSNEWKETREAQPGLNSLEKKAVHACDSRCSRPACQKPFSCSECGRRFGCKSHLKGHMMIHTGERPFSCSVCGKRFGRKTHLKGHMHSHTGHKPFSCSVCNKYFARNDYLRSHMRTHTGERPFSCSVCDQRFTWIHQLRNHQRVCCQSSQLHQRQTEQMETEADGEDCGGPEPARKSDPDRHPEPETDDKTGDLSLIGSEDQTETTSVRFKHSTK